MKGDQFERKVFHPIVDTWLKSQGYETKHEPYIGEARPDFIAVKADHTLIVECKMAIGDKSIKAAYWQIERYFNAYQKRNPGLEIRVALAAECFHQKAKDVCVANGVQVIEIPSAERKYDPDFIDAKYIGIRKTAARVATVEMLRKRLGESKKGYPTIHGMVTTECVLDAALKALERELGITESKNAPR